jgi:hypothetical protein
MVAAHGTSRSLSEARNESHCVSVFAVADRFSDPFAVVIERDAPALGQVDEDNAPVVGAAFPLHESFLFELLDQDGRRGLP